MLPADAVPLPQSLGSSVKCVRGDLENVDLEDASVIVLYLLPAGIAGLQDKLKDCLARGSRVVCNTWGMKGYEPTDTVDCDDPGNTRLELYTKESLLPQS